MSEEPYAKKARILLVDDDQNIRDALKRLIQFSLEDHGYSKDNISITMADNGQTALEKLAESSDGIDLIISDYQMPVMDGYKLLHKLPLEYASKIVFLTNAPEELEKRLSLRTEQDKTARPRPLIIGKFDFSEKADDIFRQYLG